MSFKSFVIGTAALAVALPQGPARAQDDTFRWSNAMEPGQALEVKGISGEIRAETAADGRAEVVARKKGDRDDFREVAVEVEETPDGFVVCAVYGSWNHGKGRCHPDRRDRGGDGRHRNESIDVSVEYVVRVPAGVDLQGGMVSGWIRAEGLESDVSANTVSGDIRLTTTGTARANTVSGDIEVEMGQAEWPEMDFNTVSGEITLWLPVDFSADVEFNSVSGDFDTDFEITVERQRSRWVGHNLEGTIGNGGRELSLNTVSGDVSLRRSRG
jgi:hypothetical protein